MDRALEIAKAAWPFLELALGLLIPVLVTLLTWSVRKWLTAKASAEQRAMMASIARAAYLVVEQLARRTPGKLDDKLGEALRVAALQIGRPLQPGEENVLEAMLKSMHEERKLTGSLSLADLPEGRTQIA